MADQPTVPQSSARDRGGAAKRPWSEAGCSAKTRRTAALGSRCSAAAAATSPPRGGSGDGPSALPPPPLHKDPKRIRVSGPMYEMRVAALLNARLRQLCREEPDLGLRYYIYSNVDGIKPFDDVVLHLKWREGSGHRELTYFIQIKHREKAKSSDEKPNCNFLDLKPFLSKFSTAFENLNGNNCELSDSQRVLQEWSTKKFCLALFSSVGVPLPNLIKSGAKPSSRFESIIATGSEEFILSVNDSENGQGKEKSMKNFLQCLRVFSAQLHQEDLTPLLQDALQGAVGCSQGTARLLLRPYLEKCLKWWVADAGNHLSLHSSEIEEAVREVIHGNLQLLKFPSELCQTLEKDIRGRKTAYIHVKDIPEQMRCSVLKLVLDETHANRYVVLTQDCFREYPLDTLKSLYRKLGDVLVLNVNCLNENMKELVKMKELARMEEHEKLIIVSSKRNVGVLDWMEERDDQYSFHKQKWTLSHLETEEKERFLDKRIVVQDREILLRELKELCPKAEDWLERTNLGALTMAVVGAPLQLVEDFFELLQQRAVFKESLFEMRSADDHFLLKDFPLDTPQHREIVSSWKKGHISTVNQTTWNEWETSWMDLVDGSGHKSIHVIEYENGNYVWHSTRGSCARVQANMKQESHTTRLYKTDVSLVDSTNPKINTSISILQNSPFFASMAHKLKGNGEILVVILNITDLVRDIPAEVEHADVDEMILTEALTSPGYDSFFREYMKKKSNVCVLVDGVGIAREDHRVKALQVLTHLQRMDLNRLWVAWRTPDLDNILHCQPMCISPFSLVQHYVYMCEKSLKKNTGKT